MAKSQLDKLKEEWNEVTAEMKRLAKKYVESKKSGNDSAVKMITRDLKHFTKIRKKIEKELDDIVSNIGKGASVDKIQKMTEVRRLIKQVIIEELKKKVHEAPIFGDPDQSVEDKDNPLNDEMEALFKQGSMAIKGKIEKTVDKAEKAAEKENGLEEDFGASFFIGLALALPQIITWIGQFGTWLAEKFGKEKTAKWIQDYVTGSGKRWHHFYLTVTEKILWPVFKIIENVYNDPRSGQTGFKISKAQRKKASEVAFLMVVGTMGLVAGFGAVSAFQKGQGVLAASETGLSAVKAGEVGIASAEGTALGMRSLLTAIGIESKDIARIIAQIPKVAKLIR